MFRILMTGVALAVAVPVIAQDQQVMDPASSASDAESATAQADPATGGAAANSSTQVASVVESEFPVYDADKSGDLNKAEFSKWLLALKQQEMKSTGQTLPQEQLTAWASAAFATADTDKSSTVSKAELTSYLGG